MTSMPQSPDGSGYWYSESAEAERSVAVLNALRGYRAAETAMRKRTRGSMRMGENDLTALRYLLAAKQRRERVTPKAIAERLGITGPSVTAMVDRLERSGHVVRVQNPDDGRGFYLETTPDTDVEVRATLGAMHTTMRSVADTLDAGEAAAVVKFLSGMATAVEQLE